MNLSDLNPHIRYASVHHNHKQRDASYTICYDCRMFFAENASGYIKIENEKYNISTGTAIYLPPGTRYKFSFENKNNFRMIVLDYDLINDFSHISSVLGTATEKNYCPEKAINYPLPEQLSKPVIKKIPRIQDNLLRCTKEFLNEEPFYRETSSALLKLSLIDIIKENDKNSSHSIICKNVTDYIQKNYTDFSMSNESIAQKFNYHPYHLSRIIKQETGKSLRQYIIDYRLQIAKNHLLTTEYDIEQIAWMSGFSSTSYFIKVFRQKTNTTPGQYRKTDTHKEL